MSTWDDYPAGYRQNEVALILAAVRSGECVSVIGLSGAGKSNLMGFLFYRCNPGKPALVLVDGNRAQPRSADGLFRQVRRVLGDPEPVQDEYGALENAIAGRLAASPEGLCLLFDRYDALSPEERALAAGPLRALRDGFKYRLTYVLATRRPLDREDELAELFFAHTLWLGPLTPADALWSVDQFAARHSLAWEDSVRGQLVELSRGYPSLLRACCEAYSAGVPLDLAALRDHPAVQHRLQEFWADQPAAEHLRRSGLAGHPLLGASPVPVQAASPDLTASEHRLLAYFQSHPGEVCSKDDLIRAVWPEDRVVDGLRDDSLAQLIRRLRQKIEPDPGNPRFIHTVPGRGYRYTA